MALASSLKNRTFVQIYTKFNGVIHLHGDTGKYSVFMGYINPSYVPRFSHRTQRLKEKQVVIRKHREYSLKPGGSFGFLFDIDGVFTRGKTPLPEAKKAFQLLLDSNNKWRVPAIFVTNAGNTLKKRKAETLSSMFNAHVHPNQVVMSHSPLSMFTQFHNKHVLVCGQGPIKEIASNLGFTDTVSIEEVGKRYPHLDVCDHNRRKPAPCAFERYNRRIEAVVLFGEPVKWESSLQLLLDVLITNGQPYADRPDHNRGPLRGVHNISDTDGDSELSVLSPEVNYPHIPVLACNTDLMWMAEAPIPRLAHGCFLLCLESLYEKLTGRRLLYTALVGKPSEITYHHAEFRLNQMGYKVHNMQSPVRNIYCIGDNPHTDVYGANLYNRYLEGNQGGGIMKMARKMLGAGMSQVVVDGVKPKRAEDGVVWGAGSAAFCKSILVLTGVFQEKRDFRDDSKIDIGDVMALMTKDKINHNHRDFPDYPEMRIPQKVSQNILDAIQYVYDVEGYKIN